jgi:hypothetical protein
VLAHVDDLLGSLEQQGAAIETSISPTDTAAPDVLADRIASVRGLVASARELDAPGGRRRTGSGSVSL